MGLSNSQIADYVVEALLLLTGLWFYLRATKAQDFGGKYGLPILSIILLILNGVKTFVLYPTNMESFAVTMLGVYLVTIDPTFLENILNREKRRHENRMDGTLSEWSSPRDLIDRLLIAS